MWPFKRSSRPPRAVAHPGDRKRYEGVCQHLNTATRESRLHWTEERDDEGHKSCTLELPSGRYRVKLWVGGAYHCDYYLGFARLVERRPEDPRGDVDQLLTSVALTFKFGHSLYWFINEQIHGEEYAQQRADLADAIEETMSL